MNIEDIPIKTLKHFKGNPREMNDDEMSKLISNLHKFGFVDPLVIDEDNVVLGGNQRLKAATKMGLDTAPCFRITGLNINEKRALVISLNKISGRWIEEDLEALIKLINESNPELGAFTGLTNEELDDIINAPLPNDNDPDEVPENPPTVCKKGDLWILGNHRLLCGDSTDEIIVNRLMNGKKADMVFTDPPYNTGMSEKTNSGSTWLTHMFNDVFTDEEWEIFINKFTKIYYNILKENSIAYICLDWRRNHELIPKIKLAGFHISNIIVWDKMVHGLGSDYKYTYEVINVCKKGKPILDTHQGEREYSDVWHIQRKLGKDEDHATKKPTELCERAIRHVNDVKIVVDLFGGSGSTLLSCERLNKYCYMMELDEHYCDVIIKRWEDYTGKKAIKETI